MAYCCILEKNHPCFAWSAQVQHAQQLPAGVVQFDLHDVSPAGCKPDVMPGSLERHALVISSRVQLLLSCKGAHL